MVPAPCCTRSLCIALSMNSPWPAWRWRSGCYTPARVPRRRAAALMMDEPDSTIHEHIGDTLHQLGQADEARAEWETSLALLRKQEKKMTTPDAYLLEQLGNVLHKLGQTDEATATWQRAYEITPTEVIRQKLHPANKEE